MPKGKKYKSQSNSKSKSESKYTPPRNGGPSSTSSAGTR